MIHKLFPLPILVASAKNLHGIQKECLEAMAKIEQNGFRKNPNRDPMTHGLSDPSFSSNIISEHNLATLEKEIRQQLTQFLISLGNDIVPPFRIATSWMTQNLRGEYTPFHEHGSADFSGVYYVATNGMDGSIMFYNPNPAMNNTFGFAPMGNTHKEDPEVGKMIIFPGWLQHGVESNQTNNKRISISFNIVIERRKN